MPQDALQPKLDAITTNTRALVQPERLAVTDHAVAELLASGIEQRILPVGSRMPLFALAEASPTVLSGPGATARLVRSDDLLALGPLVINFFRGRWDPYCMTELEAWQALYPALRERGALLVAISPQLPRQNDFTVQQHHLTFPVLADPGCCVAEQFGIAYNVSEALQRHYRSILVNLQFTHGNQGEATWRLPIPATFAIGRDGSILFAEGNADHRVRPEPEDVLAAL